MSVRPELGLHIVNVWTQVETIISPDKLPPDSAHDDQLLARVPDMCIVMTATHRRAYEISSGTCLWTHREDQPTRHRLLWFDNDRMLCGTEDVRAYSLQNGELLWSISLPNGLPEKTATAAGRAGFVLAGKRNVCRLDLDSGKMMGTFDLKEDVLGLAAFDEAHVVAGTLDQLYCIEFS